MKVESRKPSACSEIALPRSISHRVLQGLVCGNVSSGANEKSQGFVAGKWEHKPVVDERPWCLSLSSSSSPPNRGRGGILWYFSWNSSILVWVGAEATQKHGETIRIPWQALLTVHAAGKFAAHFRESELLMAHSTTLVDTRELKKKSRQWNHHFRELTHHPPWQCEKYNSDFTFNVTVLKKMYL